MLKNYLKIAWRNLLRYKTYSVINIVGLAIGLASFLLISLYVVDELSFDRYYDKDANIFRINMDARWGGQELKMAETSDMMGPLLKKDYPHIEQYTRIFSHSGDTRLIRRNNEYLTERKAVYVDSTFFSIFQFHSLSGNPLTALNKKNSVVITKSAAKKYFPNLDAIGKKLQVKEEGKDVAYMVTAVISDIPENTHFHFDLFFPMSNLDYRWGQLGNMNFHTYLKLKKGTNASLFENSFSHYIARYVIPALKEFHINSLEEFEKTGNKISYSLMPVTRIHLYSDRQAGQELRPSGSMQYVTIFSVVAIFILVIACINFTNLTTARSANRAREVGVRKVLGTRRQALVMQFLTESVLMVLTSLMIAIGLALIALPIFNEVAGKSISLYTLFSPKIFIALAILPFAVGLLSGSYPAFFLSKFNPVNVLKSAVSKGARSGGLRRILVVFQFATSILLITGTLVVYRQLKFIQTKDLGFNKEQVLVIDGVTALGSNAGVFKKEVLDLSGVKTGTLSSFIPVSNSARNVNNIFKNSVASGSNSFNVEQWGIDCDYLETIGIRITKGRNFSPLLATDSSAVIINETTAGILGYTDPVGQNIYTIDNAGKATAHPIIGLVKNFNFESLHQPVGPLIFVLQQSTDIASFKVGTTNINSLIEQVRNKWVSMAPATPFSYRFLNESFDDMYRSDQRAGKVAFIFSVLATFISCLGIFGLATFTSELRAKEIGIRKTFGATVQQIVSLLSFEFIKLVLIAFLIAIPLAWFVMNRWLMDYVDRISLSWWIFALSGGAAISIAMMTVSVQAIKSAIANPIRALRDQ